MMYLLYGFVLGASLALTPVATQQDTKFLDELKTKLRGGYSECLIAQTEATRKAFDNKVPKNVLVPNSVLILSKCRPEMEKVGNWLWTQGKDIQTQVLPWMKKEEQKFGRVIVDELAK